MGAGQRVALYPILIPDAMHPAVSLQVFMPSVARRVAASTGWQVLAHFTGLVTSVTGVALLTRYLGERGFGEYVTIITVGFLLVSLSDFGLSLFITRELAKQRHEASRLYWNALGIRATASFGIAALVLLTMPILPFAPPVRAGVGLFSLAAIFVSLGSLIAASLQATLRMERVAAADIANRLVGLGVIFWVATTHQPFLYLVGGLVGAQAVQFATLVGLGHSVVPIRLRFDLPVWRNVLLETAPFAGMAALAVVYARADMLILSVIHDPGRSPDVGIYGAAYRVLDALLLLPVAFLRSVFPMLAHPVGKDAPAGPISQDAFRVLSILACPILLGGIYLARPIMEIVAGHQFVEPRHFAMPILGSTVFSPSPVALQILLVAFFFMAFELLNGLVLVAAGWQNGLLRIFAFVVPLNVFLSLLLIPKYSFVGAGVATVITEIVGFVWSSRAVRSVGVDYPWGSLMRPLLAAAGMIAVILAVHRGPLNVVLLIVIGAVAYGILLYLLRGIRPADLRGFVSRRHT